MASPSREARKQRSNNAKALRLARARRRRRIKAITIALIIVMVFGGGFGLLQLTSNDPVAQTTASTLPGEEPVTQVTAAPVPAGRTISGDTPCPKADGSEERATQFEKAPPMCIDPAKNYTATFDTSEGRIVVALDPKAAPNTVNNFVVLSRYKYYDGSAIVRTNTGIDIIQGGAPGTQTNADPGPGYTINDEGGPFTYADGDLVMARTSAPNSTGSQFFFGTGPNVAQLDGQGTYLKLGKTVEGADVLDKIIGLHQPSSASDPTDGAPSKVVTVNKVTIAEA